TTAWKFFSCSCKIVSDLSRDSRSSCLALCTYWLFRKVRSAFLCSRSLKEAFSSARIDTSSFCLIKAMCISLFSLMSFALSLLYGSTAESTSETTSDLIYLVLTFLDKSSLAFFRLSVVCMRSANNFSTRGSDSIPNVCLYPSWSSRRLTLLNFCCAAAPAVDVAM
ncbi:hypothetical protein EGW08_001414, partial [Elysia chlorotica]